MLSRFKSILISVGWALSGTSGAARGRDPAPPPGSAWLEIADFLIQEEDREEFVRLQEKILTERPTDMPLIAKLLEFQVRNKDRKSLLLIMTRLNAELHCELPRASKLRRPACDDLRRLWVRNLDSVHFYEGSAQRLQEARSLMAQKDCPAAVNVLKEVESREGPSRPVLTLLEDGLKCTGDTEAAGSTVRQLEEIRIFASGSTEP